MKKIAANRNYKIVRTATVAERVYPKAIRLRDASEFSSIEEAVEEINNLLISNSDLSLELDRCKRESAPSPELPEAARGTISGPGGVLPSWAEDR